MRASSRPKNELDEAARDLGGEHALGRRVEVPTLSAREWRSAALDALGANGSCTWTKSSGAALEGLLDRARDVDRHGAAARADGERASTSPTASTGLVAAAEEQLGAVARRADQRGATRARGSCERDGASDATRWPRAASSLARRARRSR